MVDVHPFPQSGQVPVGAVMEQKLAEFRARRKAENATKTVESTANQPPRTSTALDTIEPTNEAALQAPTQANITSPYIERETIQVEVSFPMQHNTCGINTVNYMSFVAYSVVVGEV